MSKAQKPTIADNHGHGTRATHPAFAQISAHRQFGCKSVLYGSDFSHNAVVSIVIKRSEMVRDLSHDWNHGREELIEVVLSEAQWATFVSSMNMGDGVPCTLVRLQGERMPDIEPAEARTDQFGREVEEHVLEAIRAIDEALDAEPRKAVAGKLRHARMQLAQNIPFIAKSFSRHMETVVEKAKTEIHGYMNGAIRAAGLEHLGVRPIELEAPKTEDDE